MTPERWQQIEHVLQGALDRAPQDRASFIEESCGGDAELRIETESLIDAHEQAMDFIEKPALAQDAQVLVDDGFENQIGGDVGPYTIMERLGAGGMGEVYLARDRRLDRPVALKILPAYFAADDVRLSRFQREARAASALNHPNILTIHEVGEHDGVPFIATEFIDGVTVRELIASGQLTVDETLNIAEQIASALSAAHAAGIVHRDIKPENIMRRTDGLVKILDFGIAKLIEQEQPTSVVGSGIQTEVGVVMGTVDYMSPEQARGVPVDERTDIWSLGVVVYEMLTGRLPFAGPTRIDSLVAILEREPGPIWEVRNPIGKDLQKIVGDCLHKDPMSRYQNATDLLSDLKNVRHSNPEHSINWSTSARETNSQHRPSWLFMTVALSVVVLFAVFLVQKARTLPDASANRSSVVLTKRYAEMNESERLAFVSEQEQRISTLMGDRPAKLNDEALRTIKLSVDRYVAKTTPKKPGDETLNDIYNRAPPYVPLIRRAFSAQKVPVIIGIYLPVVESAYRPCVENEFGAKGLFQFLPQTAKQYGVAHSEMCEVEKMAPAAAKYIADRMAELGEDSQSLTLVLLSYNRGPESVRQTLRDLRGMENYQRNFWTLFAQREKLDDTFRNESAWYVPAFFAAAIIGENPERFGLSIPPLSTLAVDGD